MVCSHWKLYNECSVEWLESRWPVFWAHWQVPPFYWIWRRWNRGRSRTDTCDCGGRVRRRKTHVNNQSLSFWLVTVAAVSYLWGDFLSWKAFCCRGSGVVRGGISFAGRMWVCWRAFAQRKCFLFLSPGWQQLPRDFFIPELVPQWQVHPPVVLFKGPTHWIMQD